jgi:hypothetical protein
MKSPYGLYILDNCMACPVREQHIFCNLSPPTVVQRLNDITSSAIYTAWRYVVHGGPAGARGICALHREVKVIHHFA